MAFNAADDLRKWQTVAAADAPGADQERRVNVDYFLALAQKGRRFVKQRRVYGKAARWLADRYRLDGPARVLASEAFCFLRRVLGLQGVIVRVNQLLRACDKFRVKDFFLLGQKRAVLKKKLSKGAAVKASVCGAQIDSAGGGDLAKAAKDFCLLVADYFVDFLVSVQAKKTPFLQNRADEVFSRRNRPRYANDHRLFF